MPISTQLTRLAQNVGALTADTNAIFEAIAAKGVAVPSGTTLHDCPSLISSIDGASSFSPENVVNVVPVNKMAVVDSNGYISGTT